MYTCIIVDDQQEAVNLIKDHVVKTPVLSLKLATTNPVEALGFLDEMKVDIIFLDVEMPDITGLDFLESLEARWGNDMPKVIMTTGFSDYALNGFEYGVEDYLMKPISYKRFKKAIDRVVDNLNRQKEPVTETNDTFFFADIDGKKVKLEYKDIFYIEGARNYVVLKMEPNNRIIYKSMTQMMDILPSKKFIRIHKSYIISIDKIKAIRGNEILTNLKGESIYIPIGITYKKDVMRVLNIK